MKRTFVLLALATIVATTAPAQLDIRNISSVGVDANFNGTIALDVNQVVLFDVLPWLNGELKLQRQDSPVLRETTISVAPIFITSPYTYLIVRYGLGIGLGAEESTTLTADEQSRSFSHDATIDANYESSSIYANLAVRGSYYPDDDYWFVLPTVAARFRLGDRTALLGRYFFSYNSEDAVSNAVLGEPTSSIGPRFSVKAGASGSLDLTLPPGADTRDQAWEVTGITGFSFEIRPRLSLRYHLEYLGRLGNADGIRNILVLDATF